MNNALPILSFFASIFILIIFFSIDALFYQGSNLTLNLLFGKSLLILSLSTFHALVIYILVWKTRKTEEAHFKIMYNAIKKVQPASLNLAILQSYPFVPKLIALLEDYIEKKISLDMVRSQNSRKVLELGIDSILSTDTIWLIAEIDAAISIGVSTSRLEYTNFIKVSTGYMGILLSFKDHSPISIELKYWLDGVFYASKDLINFQKVFSTVNDSIKMKTEKQLDICIYWIDNTHSKLHYINHRDIPLLILKENSVFALVSHELDYNEYNVNSLQVLDTDLHSNEFLVILSENTLASNLIRFPEFYNQLEVHIEKEEPVEDSRSCLNTIQDTIQTLLTQQTLVYSPYIIILRYKK
jgi:hypothetical protein